MCCFYDAFSPEHKAAVQTSSQQLPPISDAPPASGTASRPLSRAPSQNGANEHPDPVRQLLQDELFRLVQVGGKQIKSLVLL